MKPDLSPMLGWETGRASEPGLMNHNIKSVRARMKSDPPVENVPVTCLYQFDTADATNPLGLLVAYAEEKVMPVVSDMDTLLVGSKGPVKYCKLPDDQTNLVLWCLEQTETVLEDAQQGTWVGNWLKMLTAQHEQGLEVTTPPYGFGDETSVRLISELVQTTAPCGAVRHGAECFNFYFPQEMDQEFLVVWDGLATTDGVPWKLHSEEQLREFLLARIRDGFVFPVNPVWPVRDKGWYQVFDELRASDHCGEDNFWAWYTEEIVDQIDDLHNAFQNRSLRFRKKSVYVAKK
jgi:hypothetical protein